MRDPNIRFSLDATAIKRLHALADEKQMTVSALLRALVFDVLHTAAQKETGEHEEHTPHK